MLVHPKRSCIPSHINRQPEDEQKRSTQCAYQTGRGKPTIAGSKLRIIGDRLEESWTIWLVKTESRRMYMSCCQSRSTVDTPKMRIKSEEIAEHYCMIGIKKYCGQVSADTPKFEAVGSRCGDSSIRGHVAKVVFEPRVPVVSATRRAGCR
jgi:hypothetical protein